jgi:oxygen-independent coproporphyrinogen-3 oxidase
MEGGTGIGLYIHIPFCRAKCAYCDFNSYAGLEGLFADYTAALIREMAAVCVQAASGRVKTLYLGGGTPMVLAPFLLVQLIDTIRRTFSMDAPAEVSLEANPGTVDAETLDVLRASGVNRLSLGVQSLNDRELHRLGRIHSAVEAVEAFRAARQAGFDNVNLDLIYGQPGQSLASWQASLEKALDLWPDHLSLYALTVEEGTPMAAAVARGELPEPDPDLAADMYELAQSQLAAAGFVHYEISNWARSASLVCQHNLTYWRNEPYLGLGAGAHSWLGGLRWSNTAFPARYVAQVLGGDRYVEAEEAIDPEMEMGETMMMGLRLVEEGVSFKQFRQRFGLDLREWFASQLTDLQQLGLLETDGERVTLTERGRLLGNQVFLRFLPD